MRSGPNNRARRRPVSRRAPARAGSLRRFRAAAPWRDAAAMCLPCSAPAAGCAASGRVRRRSRPVW